MHTCQTNSRACGNLTVHVETNLVRKLHSACVNHTRARRNHTRKFPNHILRLKSHFVGGNCTLRVEITLVRVEGR
jgi:hypothetical protein